MLILFKDTRAEAGELRAHLFAVLPKVKNNSVLKEVSPLRIDPLQRYVVLEPLAVAFEDGTEDLRQRGATPITVGRDIVWYLPEGKAYSPTGSVRAPFDAGLEAYCASRGLIEFVIRKRTTAIPNIRFESSSAVRELIYRDGRVCGVRCADARSIEAELVIDATGRGHRARLVGTAAHRGYR